MNNKLLWFAGVLLTISFLFPEGVKFPNTPAPAPAPAPAPVPVIETDPELLKILSAADTADKKRISGVYRALAEVLTRDDGKLVTTTERWRTLHANTLTLAIDTPGKYPGLDVAIERVFLTTVGTDDVLPNSGATQMKLIKACEIIAASAEK